MPFPDYSIAADFGGSLDSYVFHKELEAITFASANFQGLSISGDTVTTVFDVVPSAPDQALVDGAVAAYPTGTIPPLPESQVDEQTSFSDPTVSDDDSQGFGLMSRWLNITTGTSFVCTDASTGAAVWKRTSNYNNVDPDYIDCIDIFGGQTFTTTPTVILFDTIRTVTNPAVMNMVGFSGVVTCFFDGWVKVTCEISLDTNGATSTAGRTSSRSWIEINGGEQQGTRAYGYHRAAVAGEDTSTITAYLPVSNGDVIRGVSVRESTGGASLITIANASRLLVERIS